MKLVREHINFERKPLTHEELGVGLYAIIKEWAKNKEMDGAESWWIESILTDDELDDETKEKWVKFLISIEFPLDSEIWEEITNVEFNIDIIPFIKKYPDDLDVNIKKINGKYKIFFENYSDFSDNISKSNYSKDFVYDILTGDGLKYFNYFDSYYGGDIYWDKIDEKTPAIKELKQELINFGIQKKHLNNIEDIIEKTKEIDDLWTIVKNSIATSLEQSLEDQYYEYFKKSILDYFEINNVIYKDDIFEGNISLIGIKRLLDSLYLDEKMDLIDPNFDGELEKNTFNEILSDNLNR